VECLTVPYYMDELMSPSWQISEKPEKSCDNMVLTSDNEKQFYTSDSRCSLRHVFEREKRVL